MSPRRTTKTETQPGGVFYFIRDYAEDPLEGMKVGRVIMERECPTDYHPWSVRVQKSSRGRRASVEVVFKQNRLAV